MWGGLLLVAGATVVAAVVRRQHEREEARGELADCGFRIAQGTHVGLTTHWRWGRAKLGERSVTFRWVGPGRPTVIPVQRVEVVAVPLHGQRKHGYDVLFLTTPTAVVEWRIRREQLQEALKRISPDGGLSSAYPA